MIEIDEYVRTSKGIAKVIDVFVTNISEITGLGIRTDKPYGNVDIVKHSKNIIDLIEVGDYVNGYRVINVINGKCCPSGKCVDIDSGMQSNECTLWKEDIKSIVTKEQFAQAEYKIKEDK